LTASAATDLCICPTVTCSIMLQPVLGTIYIVNTI